MLSVIPAGSSRRTGEHLSIAEKQVFSADSSMCISMSKFPWPNAPIISSAVRLMIRIFMMALLEM
jgi:hypothetical protein